MLNSSYNNRNSDRENRDFAILIKIQVRARPRAQSGPKTKIRYITFKTKRANGLLDYM